MSFECLLRDEIGLKHFGIFLKSEFSEENLQFLISCQKFKICKDEDIMTEAKMIYDSFIAENASHQVNIIIIRFQ